uniref:VTT domain-containing protein n=1 Tax=Prasinoderma singulare TaxID=676789 RepID=A0A7S3BQQ6_9VIRI|mmetsp:Transcript_21223/g.65790  ORF Transcript_21223/g.65790 Transcript_21223/m.65790 type:complete len:328 (+) Transcript_21223:210-1193(+)
MAARVHAPVAHPARLRRSGCRAARGRGLQPALAWPLAMRGARRGRGRAVGGEERLCLPPPHAERSSADDAAAAEPNQAPPAVPSTPSFPDLRSRVLPVLLPVVGVALFAATAFTFKDSLAVAFDAFTVHIEQLGPWAWPAYTLAYFVLECALVPAIPLTMSAGVVLGVGPGVTAVVVGNLAAATVAFTISRTFLRERVRKLAERAPQFKAIDRAIGREGFKVVTLLRLSPLLPQANCNYVYGVSSIGLKDYMLATLLGSIPTSFLYVNAGHLGGKVLAAGGDGGLGASTWILGAGVAFTAFATAFIVRLADQALKDELDDDDADAMP